MASKLSHQHVGVVPSLRRFRRTSQALWAAGDKPHGWVAQ